jgi:hypothetical protein
MTMPHPQAANRPKEVDTSFWLLISAVVLYWLSFAISYSRQEGRDEAIRQILAGNPALDRATAENFATVVLTVVLVFGLFIAAVLIVSGFLMRGGRSWARIVLAVVGGVVLLFGLIGLLLAPTMGFAGVSGLSYVLGLLPFLLLAGAIVMMFRPAANAWFRPRQPQL